MRIIKIVLFVCSNEEILRLFHLVLILTANVSSSTAKNYYQLLLVSFLFVRERKKKKTDSSSFVIVINPLRILY